VGFVATYCNDREHGAYISSVSVLPAFRGQGLADDLVQQAVARARDRGLPRVSLHLHPDNRAAMALYIRQGFAPGLAEGDQLTMTLNLDRS
jgi:ribosomal protein S18 acetylase RimI-like enzyme